MTAAAAGGVPHIALTDVRMAFGDRLVFHKLSCQFPRGEISVILGGSGCGKSTILRLIGGLVRPQAGSIMVDDTEITRLSERRLYDVRAKVGMMFQSGALLDSLTVFDNLAFPLREHTELGEDAIAEAVHARLVSVGLTDVDELLPRQLSGGMMKRVALARATIMNPVILLCDEPFSGLDPVSAKRIEALLTELNQRFGMTMVVVSHDVTSTMRMADWVLVLLPHRAVEGLPETVRQSTDADVANFLNPERDDGHAVSAPTVAPAAGPL